MTKYQRLSNGNGMSNGSYNNSHNRNSSNSSSHAYLASVNDANFALQRDNCNSSTEFFNDNDDGVHNNNVNGIGSSSSTAIVALDIIDEHTFEVPLLQQNNDNFEYEQHPTQLELQQQHNSLRSQYPLQHARSQCFCNQPGFGSDLTNKSAQDAKCKILLAITLCCIFMVIEFVGGYLAGSLAIMTDAAHLASDCIAFVIGLVAIWLGGKAPDKRMSFGYKRFEVLGAIISIASIWILTATLVIMAVERIFSNDFDLNADTMMTISGIGILINIVMIGILHGSELLGKAAHGHGHSNSHDHSHVSDNSLPLEKNLNLRAAVIHVIGDLVQSVGVFLASVLIKFYPNAKFADPLCTLLFSVIVVLTTVRLFRESMGILLDAVPRDFNLHALELDLLDIEGVKFVHHLNVWSHTSNYNVMMAHLITSMCDSHAVLLTATKLASGAPYNIKHCTFQIERLPSAAIN